MKLGSDFLGAVLHRNCDFENDGEVVSESGTGLHPACAAIVWHLDEGLVFTQPDQIKIGGQFLGKKAPMKLDSDFLGAVFHRNWDIKNGGEEVGEVGAGLQPAEPPLYDTWCRVGVGVEG